MNDNTTKLVEALRSDKYNQGRSRLRHGDEYCCLGVACDISGVGKWYPSPKKNRERERFVYDTAEVGYRSAEGYVLPDAVKDWLGWKTDANGTFREIVGDEDEDDVALTGLNDAGVPFAQIADVIEQNADYLEGKV